MKKEPNIFEFATGELSQDAFICWLVSWLDHDAEHELKSAAKEFVALLCRIGGEDKDVQSVDIGGLGELIQQHGNKDCGKMDVFFVAEVKDTLTSFIVEDKTNSFPHSDQLCNYAAFVENENIDNLRPIIKVYYKTGYIFEKDESACKKSGYGILDYRGINEFLGQISTDNLIFNSYREYIRKRYDRYEAGLSALNAENGCRYLKKEYLQYAFMKSLSKSCPAAIGGDRGVNHGTSQGRPWTQYKFASATNIYGEVSEGVFYRIDKRNSKDDSCRGYFLSIRQYAKLIGVNEKYKPDKVIRLKLYKEVFKSVSDSGIRFSKPVGDKTGKNSSEIAVLFFDKEVNTLQNVKEKLPLFHEKFVQGLRGSSWFFC